MTQEQKHLLLVDLSARLPYQPICEFTDTEDDFCIATAALGYSLRDFIAGKVLIKPYLRPMSSMTNSEVVERNILFYSGPECKYQLNDWLDEHMFDYRGLIPMGLALEATEDMYSN